MEKMENQAIYTAQNRSITTANPGSMISNDFALKTLEAGKIRGLAPVPSRFVRQPTYSNIRQFTPVNSCPPGPVRVPVPWGGLCLTTLFTKGCLVQVSNSYSRLRLKVHCHVRSWEGVFQKEILKRKKGIRSTNLGTLDRHHINRAYASKLLRSCFIQNPRTA